MFFVSREIACGTVFWWVKLGAMTLPVTLQDIQAAAQRIALEAIRTPLIRIPIEGEFYAKPENLQRTGSFKFRGAYNALAQLGSDARVRGVVADSSGNHAQGVAAAAKMLGIPATIVIPENAPPIKVERTRAWGAEIVRCPNASDERMRMALEIRDSRNLAYIPPFDDARIIAGQGTTGLEIAQDMPDVQNVLVCVGGGGLLSGIAVAIKSLCPNARVIGVEPELAADAQESFRTHSRVSWSADRVTRTICDGVRTQGIGELNFEVITNLVDDIVTVTEDAVLEAMRFYALEVKLAVEPTGALTLAAVRSGAVKLTGKSVLIVSGGNFDPKFMAKILEG
jgi:threo-3-hydroxy-L-aspartate ammonia-lyase